MLADLLLLVAVLLIVPVAVLACWWAVNRHRRRHRHRHKRRREKIQL